MCGCIANGAWRVPGAPASYRYRLPQPYHWDAGQTIQMSLFLDQPYPLEYVVRYFLADGGVVVGRVSFQSPYFHRVDATVPKSSVLVSLAITYNGSAGRGAGALRYLSWNLKALGGSDPRR